MIELSDSAAFFGASLFPSPVPKSFYKTLKYGGGGGQVGRSLTEVLVYSKHRIYTRGHYKRAKNKVERGLNRHTIAEESFSRKLHSTVQGCESRRQTISSLSIPRFR